MARFSFIVILLISDFIFAQNLLVPKVDSLLSEGINQILQENYESAETIFVELDKKNPDMPLGNIYLAATEIARSVDFFDRMNTGKIESYFERAEEISDSLYDNDDENILNIYFKGLLSGYRAYYSALNGDYFNAFTDGYDSYSFFLKCIEKDTLFYEAYIAIGSFEYWISAKTEFFGFLPFYDDNRANGISLLEIAWKKTPYNSHLAAHSLIWIYINEKRYNDAIKIAEEELKKYPDSRFFKWGLANAYRYVNKRKSIQILQQILESYALTERNILVPKVVIMHKIAMLENDLGDKKTALKLCDEILKTCEKIKEKNDEISERCSRAEELKNTILNEK